MGLSSWLEYNTFSVFGLKLIDSCGGRPMCRHVRHRSMGHYDFFYRYMLTLRNIRPLRWYVFQIAFSSFSKKNNLRNVL